MKCSVMVSSDVEYIYSAVHCSAVKGEGEE